MLEQLFSSRVRAKILTKFLLSPGAGYNAWELSKSLIENYSAVWKELVNLENVGVLSSTHLGNAKVYSVNPACPIIPELRSLVIKTEGIGDALRGQLSQNEGIKAAFIFGSYASGEADTASDIDLMVIGKIDLAQFSPIISSLENEIQRPINYLIYTEEEWADKLAKGDSFALNIKNSSKIMLWGDENAV